MATISAGAGAAPPEASSLGQNSSRAIFLGLVVSSPAALRIAKHALAESLVSGARSGDVVMVMGDGSDLSSFHAMAFDTSDRQSFQDVLDTVGSTSSCVASALACTRVYDCIHSAIKCISSDVVQSVSGVEVLIATDLPADAPLPRHYSKLARELDAHSEVSVRLAVLGDGPLAEDGLLGSLASRPNVVCYTGGNAFAQITRALCTATSPAEPSAELRVLRESPAGNLVGLGGLAVLVFETTGMPNYQWCHDGVDVPYGVGPRLVIPAARPVDSGAYTCTASIGDASIVSKTFKLGLSQDFLGVSVTSEPAMDGTVIMPSAGSTVTLTSVITPSIPSGSSIQWFKDGKAIRSPSDPRRLVLPAVSSELTGEYTCRVTTGQQCVTSAPVTLAMAAEAPYIVWHTSTKFVIMGRSESLQVHALGYPPDGLRYQWHHNGVPIEGGTQPLLQLNAIDTSSCGVYFCKVWNEAGSTRTGLIELLPSKVDGSGFPPSPKKSQALSPVVQKIIASTAIPVSPVQTSRVKRVSLMTSRSKSVDLDRSATSLRVVTASPSEMKLLSKAANEVPRPGHFGPDRVKALEATVEDLQNLIRTQAATIQRQEDQLHYRAKRVKELEGKLVSTSEAYRPPASSPTFSRAADVTISKRQGLNRTPTATATVTIVSSPPSPPQHTPSPLTIANTLRRLKSVVQGTRSPRSRSLDHRDTNGIAPSSVPIMAPVPYSATLRERLDDAEARAAAYAQLIREKDATITRLGQDLRVRTKKLGEAVAALEPLQAEICALKVEVERLRRRVKL